jgi:hypothetical protein
VRRLPGRLGGDGVDPTQAVGADVVLAAALVSIPKWQGAAGGGIRQRSRLAISTSDDAQWLELAIADESAEANQRGALDARVTRVPRCSRLYDLGQRGLARSPIP